jgi:ABC-type transport system substrate-binding protein
MHSLLASAWRNNEIEGYSYNMEKAKELLAEAGGRTLTATASWTKTPDIQDHPLHLAPASSTPLIEQAVQSQLKEIASRQRQE